MLILCDLEHMKERIPDDEKNKFRRITLFRKLKKQVESNEKILTSGKTYVNISAVWIDSALSSNYYFDIVWEIMKIQVNIERKMELLSQFQIKSCYHFLLRDMQEINKQVKLNLFVQIYNILSRSGFFNTLNHI